MKNMTAVEWLIDELIELKTSNLSISQCNSIRENIFEQAKQMEKEQMINFAENYEMWESENYPRKTFEQYYNETFKSE